MDEKQRIVITGMGMVSSLGVGVARNWEYLTAGKSGIGPITKFDASHYRCRIAGEVRDLDISQYLPPKEARRLDPFCHFAVAAADEALRHAGITSANLDPNRVGVVIGAGIGGISTLQDQGEVLVARGPTKSSPLMVPMMIIDMAAGFLSIRYGFKGPNMGIVTACASGSHAIGEAMWMIRRGDADVMLTGGAEACICPLGLTGFNAMKALSERNDDPTRASRPFDLNRDGFVPGEGAGILVLESIEHARSRNATIYGEIIGYGLSGDAYHITAPGPDGEGAARAISAAMKQAGIRPDEIDYVNAHGTSTGLNDKVETLALKKALGQQAYKTAVSSTKSMTGHALGAAGGLESIFCLQTILTGVIPPTINYETPDPECDLDYVPLKARAKTVNVAMNINLGFGGHNAVLLFRKYEG